MLAPFVGHDVEVPGSRHGIVIVHPAEGLGQGATFRQAIPVTRVGVYQSAAISDSDLGKQIVHVHQTDLFLECGQTQIAAEVRSNGDGSQAHGLTGPAAKDGLVQRAVEGLGRGPGVGRLSPQDTDHAVGLITKGVLPHLTDLSRPLPVPVDALGESAVRPPRHFGLRPGFDVTAL